MFHYAVCNICGGETDFKMTANDKGDSKRFQVLMQCMKKKTHAAQRSLTTSHATNEFHVVVILIRINVQF